MSSELKKLFTKNNQQLPPKVIECFEILETDVVPKIHSTIQTTHIFYAYMILLKKKLTYGKNNDSQSFKKDFPILATCYINPDDFSKQHEVYGYSDKNSENKPKISNDLLAFANLYNLFSMSYDFNFETFYLLLLYYSKYLRKSTDTKYIPIGNVEFKDNESLSDFLKRYGYCDFKNMAQFLETENQLSTNTEYLTSITVPYMTDLTHKMYIGELSTTFVGRENELHQLINILSKKNKNNPVLIGESGVGKTALVHALANKIVTNQISSKLQYYRILEFDITLAIAGTKYRGYFEERIKKSLDEIVTLTNSGNKIILYIDEIHNIVGTRGSMDLASILKPFLLNSSVQVIGTSTFKGFRTIESDKPLERRLNPITINEPSINETVAILTSLKHSMEKFHNLTIADSTIKSVVTLSKRYIPEKYLPDKAIDLLDETCATKANSDTKSEVLPDDVCFTISIKKGIPIHKVQDACDLINLESDLNFKVIGQPLASESLAKAVRRTLAGLNDEKRPFASFMFVGPTGVGKTEMAKALADLVFSDRDHIIRFDMSEYMEEHSVSKLIGSPPGYVGYEEAGLLTEQVRRNPYSLVLFDEFEKAHPKICNILLQILDEGSLTDSKGQHINFKNTIIILTSNIGASELAKPPVGFLDNLNSNSKTCLSAVKKTFSPEFLNRLDDVIQFRHLSEDDIYKIANFHILNLIKKVNDDLKIKIDISDEVISKIAQLGYSYEYGARELRRTIDKEIKDPLADLILQNDVGSVSVQIQHGQIKVFQTKTISV